MIRSLALAQGYVDIVCMVRRPYERVYVYAWPLGGDRYQIQRPHPALRGGFNFLKLPGKNVANLSLRRLPREGAVVACRRDDGGKLHFAAYRTKPELLCTSAGLGKIWLDSRRR